MENHTADTGPATSRREVRSGASLCRVSSFVPGEKDLGKTLEQLAVRRAMSEVSVSATSCAGRAT